MKPVNRNTRSTNYVSSRLVGRLLLVVGTLLLLWSGEVHASASFSPNDHGTTRLALNLGAEHRTADHTGGFRADCDAHCTFSIPASTGSISAHEPAPIYLRAVRISPAGWHAAPPQRPPHSFV